MNAHIFVDNSNIFQGARRAAQTSEPTVDRAQVRVYYKNFFELIERGYSPVTRVLAGSVPPGNDDLWHYSREAGYSTDLLRRVDTVDGGSKEQGVDEILHLKIAHALLDHEPPQVLVIATGDSAVSEFGTSFTDGIARALRRKWNVRLWSWREQIGSAFLRQMEHAAGAMTVSYLNDFYEEITFVNHGRVVEKLRY
ncbi:NYN domain-containing protein [Rhizobacter sp. P5_C2]